MSRRATALAAVVVTTLASASPATAATRFSRCADEAFARCATVRVPLDHDRRGGPRIGLHVERWRGVGRRRTGALLVLAGGPGQSSSAVVNEDFLPLLGPGLRGRDLIAADQRGTGRSGALRCRGLTRALRRPDRAAQARAAERCARGLGSRRALYTTRQSVEDIEAIRRALGVRRIAIYGVSYGTKLAQAYARRHPGRVERLVLDSVLDTGGPDFLQRPSLAALPRVLRALCERRCGAITPDVVADMTELARRVEAEPLRGTIVDREGRARARTLEARDLLDIALIGDLAPEVSAGLPAAMRNALRGDPVPLLRLGRSAGVPGLPLQPVRPAGRRGEPPERFFSDAMFSAVTCEDGPAPWRRTTPPDERQAEIDAFVTNLGPDPFAPFGTATALASPYMTICGRWPSAAEAPVLRGRMPKVPALLLNGEADLRTPVEGARRVADRLPRARLVTVPGVGHSVLSGIAPRCARVALRDFFRGRRVDTGCRNRYIEPLAPLAPLTLDEAAEAPGTSGPRGRAVTAAWLTIEDASEQANLESRGGGLRGGTYRYGRRLVLDRAEFVPGVEVSGRVDVTLDLEARHFGEVRITGPGAPNGTLTFRRNGTVSGTLDGERVSGRAPR